MTNMNILYGTEAIVLEENNLSFLFFVFSGVGGESFSWEMNKRKKREQNVLNWGRLRKLLRGEYFELWGTTHVIDILIIVNYYRTESINRIYMGNGPENQETENRIIYFWTKRNNSTVRIWVFFSFLFFLFVIKIRFRASSQFTLTVGATLAKPVHLGSHHCRILPGTCRAPLHGPVIIFWKVLECLCQSLMKLYFIPKLSINKLLHARYLLNTWGKLIIKWSLPS